MWKIIFLLIIGFSSVYAQRTERTINDGWRFAKGNKIRASALEYDDSQWEKVVLPHSWNNDAYTYKKYYRGETWYRRNLTIATAEADRKKYLHFEAVNHSAEVYVNGMLAGTHRGGYTAFTIDITPYCKVGEDNIIAVKADNSEGYIPTISADFTMFGGIYRDVWLITTPAQHIDMLDSGSKGIYITPYRVSEEQAYWKVAVTACNESTQKSNLILEHKLVSPEGKTVSAIEKKLTLQAGEKRRVETSDQIVENPMLWSPEIPNLYTLETIIKDRDTGKELDKLVSRMGFRWFSIDTEKGFFLNGKHYKLNGVCRHQDQQPLGNALSDEMHRRDMKLIKEMGVNFIRISHYPQDEAILEQCDRLGLIAWEEIPVIDLVHPAPQYDSIAHTMLREMIRQHYNYPSIVMWGYMNEILLRGSAMVNGEKITADKNKALLLAKSLEKTLRSEDPTRLSAMAFHGSEIYYKEGFGEITDIIGWNLYSGWYGGKVSNFDIAVERQHGEHPFRPIIVSEYGAGSDRRLHSFSPRSFDFSIEYQQLYLEHYLPVIERYPWILGGAHWNFIDFGSAPRDESMPRINNKGLLYNDRTPKDVYYLFKAAFRRDIPVLHIASRDWSNRIAVGSKSAEHVIKIYTNLPEAELFVNGISQGVKKTKNNVILFDVSLTTGQYVLTAKGGGGIEDNLMIQAVVVPDVLTERNIDGLELAVNVGSNCSYTSPYSNLTWVADREYTPGSWGYIGGEPYQSAAHTIGTQVQIHGAIDNPLFQTLRIDLDAYKFDLPDGRYELELCFADVFGNSTAIAHQLGAQDTGKSTNVFNISINNVILEKDFYISNSSGFFQAVIKKYIIAVDGRKGLTVSFGKQINKTFLNGIKIRRL